MGIATKLLHQPARQMVPRIALRPEPKGQTQFFEPNAFSGMLRAGGAPPRAERRVSATGWDREQNYFFFFIVGPHPLWYVPNMDLVSQTELKKLFFIDPETGVCRRRNGRKTGSLSQKGYLRTNINGREYRVHRLVWLWVHGKHPPEGMTIDHINGDKTDNRITNLRLATVCQNTAYALGKSDMRNIIRDAKGFRVEMIVNGVRYRRRASTLEKAFAVRKEMHARFPPLEDR